MNKDGEEVEMQHALTTKIGNGQVLKPGASFQKEGIMLHIPTVNTVSLGRGTPGDVSWGEEEASDS